MSLIFTISTVLLILLIGFIFELRQSRSLLGNIDFVNEYLENFMEYANSKGSNKSKYNYLVMNSNKMQNLLGNQGFATIRLPFENVMYNHWALIINGLSQMHSYFSRNYFEQQAFQVAEQIRESLIRKIGDYTIENETKYKRVFNPVIWFATGIRFILSIPILILESFGIIGINGRIRAISSFFFKFIAGIVALIGLVSSIFSIVFGWDQIIEFMKKLLGL
jgi:hypothetical protein